METRLTAKNECKTARFLSNPSAEDSILSQSGGWREAGMVRGRMEGREKKSKGTKKEERGKRERDWV